MTEHFWKRFSGEYLTELRERAKHGKDNTSAIKVGDVVIINQRNMLRNSWPLGKVVRLVKSSDEPVRGAVLTSRGCQLSRPLNLLYPGADPEGGIWGFLPPQFFGSENYLKCLS